MSHYDISMRKQLLTIIVISSLLLSGCTKGLSADEKLACDALSDPWESVDFSETSNFNDLYENYGVSQLGDNSASAKILTQNRDMASMISDGLKEGDDKELMRLAKSHSNEWGFAASNGLTVLRSVIGTAKDGNTELNSVQSETLNNSIGNIKDAEKIAEEIRTRCNTIGYKSNP
jgi:hypothetical protein